MPAPQPDALTRALREAIDAEGPLPFSRFMATALYDPQHGYYAREGFTTGREGDFATAPDTGPLFGATLARLADRFGQQPGQLVELGPGSGRLAKDLLDHLDDDARANLDVLLVEPFEARHEALRDHLAPHDVTVRTGLEGLAHTRTLAYANEVLDAQPTEVVRRAGDGWEQLHVGSEGEGFCEVWTPAREEVAAFAEKHAGGLEEGARYEACLASDDLLSEIGRNLGNDLAVLLFDYGGRFHDVWPDRPDGTLRGFRDHQQADVLERPGSTDITFDVDFTAIEALASDHDLSVATYGEQERFLTHLGLVAVAQAHGAIQAAKQLIVPGAFAGRFQAMVLGRGTLCDELGLVTDLRDPALWARAARELGPGPV